MNTEEAEAWLTLFRKFGPVVLGFLGISIQLVLFAMPPHQPIDLRIFGACLGAMGWVALPVASRPSV